MEFKILLLSQGSVSIEEFFVVPKNGTLETNKPSAMYNIINLRKSALK